MDTNDFATGLVSTQWLADHLGESDVRVLDCTTHLRPDPPNVFRVESGLADWEAGHIPGAAYVDLQGELSDLSSSLRFMLPSAEQFAAAMSAKGIGDGHRVVLYSTTTPQWATRIWWMLRAFGFDNASVLDGGYAKWVAEGRETSTAASTYPAASFTATLRPGLLVGKQAVLAGLSDDSCMVLNALAPTQHAGTDARNYGRPGRIAGSTNVPAASLLDGETGAFLPAEQLRKAFDEAGAFEAGRVIHYCGGGIAASATAFIMTLLGHDDVALYDASLSEWAVDEALPMEVG